MMVKDIPILVPTMPRFGERKTRIEGWRETKEPEKKPKRMQKTRIDTELPIDKRHRMSTPESKAHGTIMLNAPVLSARKLGMIRPKVEAAFMTGSRWNPRL